jgi:hypothetical protein
MNRENVGRGITVDVSRNLGFLAYSAKISQSGYNVFANYHRIINKGIKFCTVLVASLMVSSILQVRTSSWLNAISKTLRRIMQHSQVLSKLLNKEI